jgi:hypothetical protein
MEIRRIQFDQGFLDAVRANMKPANQLQVLRTPQWDLAVASQRRDAVEALMSLFAGLQCDLYWTEKFNTFMNVWTAIPSD